MKNNLFDRIVAPQVILCAIAIGFLGLFIDKSLLVEEDAVMLFQMNSMSDKTNGWRPDVAYGMSNFFSDPGTVHPWGISGLWSSLFSDRVFGQNILFIILISVSCLSLYFFLRKIVPEVSKTTLLFLALLIPFSSLRYEFIFVYCMIVQIIGASMGAYVLYQSLTRPRSRYYFYYIIIIWTLVFFGSSILLFQFLSFTLLFSFGIFIYHGFYKKWNHFKRIVWRYLSINIIAGIHLLFLGGWIFYGLLLDQSIIGYVRANDYTTNSWMLDFEPLSFFLGVARYFHAGFISPWSGALGVTQTLGGHSWNNVSPITPVLIVIFLFLKSRNFWEFSAKYVVFSAYLYHEIFHWFPGLLNYIQSLVHLYPPDEMHPFIQVFQIVLIAFLVDRLTCDNVGFDIVAKQKISRALALVLSFFYMGGLVFVLFIKLFPEYLLEKFLKILPWVAKNSGLNLEFGETLIKENISLLEETLGWVDLLFFSTTLIIMGIFISRFGPSLIRFRSGFVFALALLANNYFLSLSVYPLNSEPLIWDKQQVGKKINEDFFGPTDRLARVTLPPCRGHSDYVTCIKNKFFNKEFGAQRHQVGYRDVPSIELSRPTSFIPQFNSKYIKKIMRDPEFSVGDLRKKSIDTSEYFWDLLNVGAVNYLLSNTSIPEKKQLELVYKSKQFYLYRNIDAWPYYYFANRIKIIEDYEGLYEQKPGVAYLWENIENFNFLENQVGFRNIELVKFEHGDLEFQYKSKKSEFLVIADSWHPNWKASINGKEVPVFKANGIFKGVLLPSGEGKLNLLFDNSIYYPGIWVSFVSWSVFFIIWGLFAFRLRKGY